MATRQVRVIRSSNDIENEDPANSSGSDIRERSVIIHPNGTVRMEPSESEISIQASSTGALQEVSPGVFNNAAVANLVSQFGDQNSLTSKYFLASLNFTSRAYFKQSFEETSN